MASLLGQHYAFQNRPLGTTNALSKTTQDQGNVNGPMSSAGKQYRELEKSYGRALRILNHGARRGDKRAAMGAINVRKQAMGDGMSPGGIRRVDERNADINSMVRSKRSQGRDLAMANQNDRAGNLLNRRELRNRFRGGMEPEKMEDEIPDYDTLAEPDYKDYGDTEVGEYTPEDSVFDTLKRGVRRTFNKGLRWFDR